MPVDPNKTLSLSKYYGITRIKDAIAGMTAGMSETQVYALLPAASQELADDLFVYAAGGLVEDTLVKACQNDDSEAPILVWVALLLADLRLQRIVTDYLTAQDGKINPTVYNPASLITAVNSVVGDSSDAKTTTNILSYLENAGIVTPTKHGGSITGVGAMPPTSFAVPQVLALFKERLGDFRVQVAPDKNALVDLAIGVGVHHWVNLTPDEFRKAAHPQPAAAAMAMRSTLPNELEQLDRQLRRKLQVVLQGPPGVGKTFISRGAYLDWFAAGKRDEAQLASIITSLPSHERTPLRIVDEVVRLGLPGVWEIVQFHPSYAYERFVRGLQATPTAVGVSFEPVNRMLGLLAAIAVELETRGVETELLLLIDEINRGDLAKIFGELLFALEYREEKVSTSYVIDGDATLVLPKNLLIIGTMNTADESIAMLDKALRRRFGWVSLWPDRDVITTVANTFAANEDRTAAAALFDRVAAMFDENDPEQRRLQVGHSYFLPEKQAKDTTEAIRLVAERFAYDGWPLIEEYEAEGLISIDKVDDLLSGLGWKGTARPRDQDELQRVVEGWLKTQAEPPAVATPATATPGASAASDGDGSGGDGGATPVATAVEANESDDAAPAAAAESRANGEEIPEEVEAAADGDVVAE
jgi:5-methylcytosine-specific restriction enzyme B